MDSPLTTGLCATRTGATAPDMTFIWSASLANGLLQVSVAYGGGFDINNVAKATIGQGSTSSVEMVNAGNSAISVIGKVAAVWGDSNKSYIVTFSGQMVLVDVNDVLSSDQNGDSSEAHPIIVCAYLH